MSWGGCLAYAAGYAALAQFVVGKGLLGGVLARQRGQAALNFPPYAANGYAEDSLTALHEVDDLVCGGTFVDTGAVAHQGDLREVLHATFAKVLHGGPDLLE